MKYLVCFVFAVAVSPVTASGADFTPGHLVVYRVGDGSAALSSAATPVFLDEYSPAGVLVQSIALPTSTTGANLALTAAGNATSEGMLNRSADGRFITITGYNAAPGTASVALSPSNLSPRVVGRVDARGQVDTTTSLGTLMSGTNVRSAVSTNGTDLWISGALNGVVYTTVGATVGTQIQTTITNTRAVDVFSGQLYVSTNTGSPYRLATVGTGTPTTAGQTVTNLPNFPTSTGSPYEFVFLDLESGIAGVDTLYVADDSAGIQKYSFNGTTWTLGGTIAATSVRGLTGSASGGTVTLFASSPTNIFKFTDTAAFNAAPVSSVTTLATAGTNTAFRGLDFTPGIVPEPGTASLLLAGLGTLAARRVRRD